MGKGGGVCLLGASWGGLVASWSGLGRSSGGLEQFWGDLGTVLGQSVGGLEGPRAKMLIFMCFY